MDAIGVQEGVEVGADLDGQGATPTRRQVSPV
jgi:hypothetical protein